MSTGDKYRGVVPVLDLIGPREAEIHLPIGFVVVVLAIIVGDCQLAISRIGSPLPPLVGLLLPGLLVDSGHLPGVRGSTGEGLPTISGNTGENLVIASTSSFHAGIQRIACRGREALWYTPIGLLRVLVDVGAVG